MLELDSDGTAPVSAVRSSSVQPPPQVIELVNVVVTCLVVNVKIVVRGGNE